MDGEIGKTLMKKVEMLQKARNSPLIQRFAIVIVGNDPERGQRKVRQQRVESGAILFPKFENADQMFFI